MEGTRCVCVCLIEGEKDKAAATLTIFWRIIRKNVWSSSLCWRLCILSTGFYVSHWANIARASCSRRIYFQILTSTSTNEWTSEHLIWQTLPCSWTWIVKEHRFILYIQWKVNICIIDLMIYQNKKSEF